MKAVFTVFIVFMCFCSAVPTPRGVTQTAARHRGSWARESCEGEFKNELFSAKIVYIKFTICAMQMSEQQLPRLISALHQVTARSNL